MPLLWQGGDMTVLLRPWRPTDAPALVAARASAADLDTQFPDVDLSTTDQAAAHIASALPFGGRTKHWAIVDDGVAVGDIALSAIEWRHETAWVSYWLAAGARGRGLATAALTAVADYAFADGLFRLELGHRVNNPASCRVASRAGFVAEGLERAKLRYGDERFDVETHARLATDPVPAGRGLPLEG